MEVRPRTADQDILYYPDLLLTCGQSHRESS